MLMVRLKAGPVGCRHGAKRGFKEPLHRHAARHHAGTGTRPGARRLIAGAFSGQEIKKPAASSWMRRGSGSGQKTRPHKAGVIRRSFRRFYGASPVLFRCFSVLREGFAESRRAAFS